LLEKSVRPWLQDNYINLLSKKLIGIGIKQPNLVTLASCFVGVLFSPLILLDLNGLAIFCLLLSGLLDILDGTIARQVGESSKIGTVYDIISDRVVEFSVILGLFLIDPQGRALGAMFMLGSVLLCVTSFLVVGIVSEQESNKSFDYSPGLMERAEAFIFFIVMILLPAFFNNLALLFTVLVIYTMINRLVECRAHFRNI
jgi:archaetidylinositol phosphate synthase